MVRSFGERIGFEYRVGGAVSALMLEQETAMAKNCGSEELACTRESYA